MSKKPVFINKEIPGQKKFLTSDKKSKFLKVYSCWINIRKRCYSEEFHLKYPTYQNCTVHPEWHNFQNFAKWYGENFILGWQLDKDILVPGNKVYGPDTCCFLPPIINTQFQLRGRKSKFGLGVSKDCNKYYIDVLKNVGDKTRVRLTFDNIEDAKINYIEYKENLIKQLTETFKDSLNTKVYEILINFKVSDYAKN